jgi:dihydroorotate dehydrogenase
MFYHPLRALLFQLDPETAHDWTIQALRALPTQPLGACFGSRVPAASCRVMGLDFPNPVGLVAAGASLVQLYTGLIYRGPALAREVVTALR